MAQISSQSQFKAKAHRNLHLRKLLEVFLYKLNDALMKLSRGREQRARTMVTIH